MSSQFTLQVIQVRLYNIKLQLSTHRSELEAIPSEGFLFGWWKLFPVSWSRISELEHVFQWLTAIFLASTIYSSFILVFCSHLLLFWGFLRTDLFTNTAAIFDQCIKYTYYGMFKEQIHTNFRPEHPIIAICWSYWTLFIIAKCLKEIST